MDGIGYFLWLANEAFSMPILFPPAGILMALGIVIAMSRIPNVTEDRQTWAALAGLLPPLFPAVILWCGVQFHCETGGAPNKWAEIAIDALVFLHLPLALLLIVKTKGARALATGVSMAAFGYSLCTSFVSGMSVTGLWL